MSAIKTSGRGEGAAVAYPHMYVCAARKFVYNKNIHNAQENNRKIGKKNAAGIFFLST
jgi:hypothetical protein